MPYSWKDTLSRLRVNEIYLDSAGTKVYRALLDKLDARGDQTLPVEDFPQITKTDPIISDGLVEIKDRKFVLTTKGRDMRCNGTKNRRATKLQKWLAWSMNND
jgi:hypothetical protein